MAEKTIFCPHCKQKLTIEEDILGMEVECPLCHQNFTARNPEPPKLPQLGNFKLKLNNIAANNAATEETKPAEINADDTGEDELVAQDDNEDGFAAIEDEFTAIEDDEFAAIDLSDDEDNLPEPDPGFLNEDIAGRNALSIGKKFGLSCGLFVIALIIGAGIAENLKDGAGNELAKAVLILFLVIGAILAALPWIISLARKASTKKHWKRDLVNEYFTAHQIAEAGVNIAEKLVDGIGSVIENIPGLNLLPLIMKGVAQNKRDKYCQMREPVYDAVQKLDMQYLRKLNVLHRFGKDKKQLVSPMQTLFSPAFGGVPGLREFQYIVSAEDENYRYNLEEVTKVYTFEDQLFIYTGVWAYGIGKMISESTEAFFFRDITDIKTRSNFKIHTTYKPKGCLSILIPGMGKPIEKVYKESESFVLTSASGNSIGLSIGFEDAITVTGATYTHRNNNERIIHAIRKMIEEKKLANNG